MSKLSRLIALGILDGGGAGLLFNDTFTDTDDVIWANHVPELGTWSVTSTGLPAKISANSLKGAQAFKADTGLFTANISDNLYFAVDGYPGASGQLNIIFRYVDSGNYWYMGLSGANFWVRHAIRGTLYTQATGMNPSSMHNLYFSVIGLTVSFWWEGGGPLTYTISGTYQNLTAITHGLNIYNFGSGAVDKFRFSGGPINPT